MLSAPESGARCLAQRLTDCVPGAKMHSTAEDAYGVPPSTPRCTRPSATWPGTPGEPGTGVEGCAGSGQWHIDPH
jgi:hypothetical protein